MRLGARKDERDSGKNPVHGPVMVALAVCARSAGAPTVAAAVAIAEQAVKRHGKEPITSESLTMVLVEIEHNVGKL